MAASITARPGGARILAYGVSAVLVAMTVAVGVALPSDIEFTTFELITLAVLLGGVLWGLHGVGRSRVSADDDGVVVVNGYRTHRFAWSDVAGISMKNGDPWPTLLTSDDRRVMLFAIQATDGQRARTAVQDLRARLGA